MTEFILFSLIGWLLGALIHWNELRLLSGHYHYKIGRWQWVTYVSSLLSLMMVTYDVVHVGVLQCVVASLLMAFCYAVVEWMLSKWSPLSMAVSVGVRLIVLLAGAYVLRLTGYELITPFVLAGLWFRNSPFGVVHGFKMLGAQHIATVQYQDRQTATVNVTEHGIMPNTGKDD